MSERVSILYEPSTGKVKHLHYSVAIQGGELPPDADLEKRALEVAARLKGLAPDTVRAIHVDATEVKRHSRHRVEVATKRLISEPLKRKRRTVSK
jgi:hypothetical protein